MHLRAGQFEEAIDLYLQQLALGDNSAYESLRTTARRALEAAPATLDYLARLPRARAILTPHSPSLALPSLACAYPCTNVSPLRDVCTPPGLACVRAPLRDV